MKFKRIILAILLLISLPGLLAVPAQAQTPTPTPNSVTQEDPEKAKVVFSGLALLLYYSSSLEPVLQKDSAGTQEALAIMQFANIPKALDEPTAAFAVSSVELAGTLAGLFQLWDMQNELVRQYRLKDARELGDQVTAGLPLALQQLSELRSSVDATGSYLKIESAKRESELTLVYAEVQSKLDRLQAMLDLLQKPLLDIEQFWGPGNLEKLAAELGLTLEQLQELLNSGDVDKLAELINSLDSAIWQQILNPTALILEIDPLTAFVGDTVRFSGTLTAHGSPLAGREIDLLLNNTRYTTVSTDAAGRLDGTLSIPYWYQPTLDVQAVYYPHEADIGRYLGSSSPVVRLNVLFYAAALTVATEGKTYPGRTATINGVFNYGEASPIGRTGTRVSLDDNLLTEFIASPVFALPLDISPAVAMGRHTLTMYVPADGRYAPVSASSVLEVVLAQTMLDFNLPRIGLTPGSLKLKGRAYSDLGPLQDAALEVRMEDNSSIVTSTETGDFDTRLKIAPGFSLLGTQTLTINVQPQEPWNAPLAVTRSVFIINWLSCGALLLILLAMAVILPRRIRNWSRGRSPAVVSPMVMPAPPPVAPVYEVTSISPPRDESHESEKSPESIFNWYRFALKLMQKVTQTVLKPQQTLREYVRENNRAMGPLGRYFLEFTFLIERLLYSRHQADPDDTAKARQLSQTIRKESPREDL